MPGVDSNPIFESDPLDATILIPDPAMLPAEEAIQPGSDSAAGGTQSPIPRGLSFLAADVSNEGPVELEKLLQAIDENGNDQESEFLLKLKHVVQEEVKIPKEPRQEPYVDKGWFEDLAELNRQIKPEEQPSPETRFLPVAQHPPSRTRMASVSRRVRLPSIFRVYQKKCEICGGEAKENRCENCEQESCGECGWPAEYGICPSASCPRHRFQRHGRPEEGDYAID